MKPILSLRNITKKYDGLVANHSISLDAYLGSVHAIVGENGAGKSTLMKIIFGLETANEGEIFHRDQLVQIRSPKAAKNLRIAMVHQHFMLAENLTVEDHLRLEVNSTHQNWGVGPYRQLKDKIAELCDRLNLKMPLDTLVSRLSVIQKQKLEILKTLLFDPEIIIFDEPTAVLPPSEMTEFYRLIADLKSQNLSILIITHKLHEVMQNADLVSVLRFGKLMFQAKVSDTNASEIARHMVGEAISANSSHSLQPIETTATEPRLTVKNFSLENHLHIRPLQNINVTVNGGEIVAFAGVEGNGQSELLKCILFPELGDECKTTGDVTILGQTILDSGRRIATHSQIRKLPLGWIGEDRLGQSAIASYSLDDHYRLLPAMRDSTWLKPIDADLLKQGQIQFDIRPAQTNLFIDQFSGGNQQKWVVARETCRSPDLLIAGHPTRGVDFAAAKRIHNTMIELRNQVKSVILLSSDLDEILEIADRIYIFFKGRVTREFKKPFLRDAIGEELGGKSFEDKNRVGGDNANT